MPFRLSPYFVLFCRGLYDSIQYSFNVLTIDEDFSKETATSAASSSSSRHSSQQHPHQPRPKTNAGATNNKKRIRSSLILLCLFNGGILLIGMLCFHYIFLPTIRQLFFTLAGLDSSSSSSQSLTVIQHILTYTFNFLWLIPAYIISKFVNSYWFEDIAGIVFKKLTRGSSSLKPLSPARAISDIIFSIVMQLFFLFQSTLIILIPIPVISTLIGYTCLCLLYSFYSFEYAWLYRNFELRYRVQRIETNWPYFLGFGLPLTVVSNALFNSLIINGCIFSILFPYAIVAATSVRLTERTRLSDGPAKIVPLNIFSFCIRLTNWLFQLINVRRGQREEIPAQS